MTVKGYGEAVSRGIADTVGSIKVENKPQTSTIINSINGINTNDKNAQNVSKKLIEVLYEDSKPENLLKFPTSNCNRCKKKFAQTGPKSFKMCEHCRILQRQRSRRWQKRTKQKEGVCTRCGSELPLTDNNFVLCQHCRDMLRSKKANRYLEGKCVHCSGPNDEEGIYKVCKRCREKDKLRRLSLEHNGLCNRCTSRIPNDQKGHKICQSCRMKKRKVSLSLDNDALLPERTIIRNIDVNDLFTDEIIPKDKRIRQRKRVYKSPAVSDKNNVTTFEPTSKLDTNLLKKDIDFDIKHDFTSITENKIERKIDSVSCINDNNSKSNNNNDDDNNDNRINYSYNNNKNIDDRNIDNSNDDNINNRLNNESTKDSEREQFVANITNTDASNTRSIHDDNLTIEVNGNNVEHNRNDYGAIQNSNESITSTIILSESFNIPHDHSQLNQQLKQLGQFTSHSSDEGEDDVDDEGDNDEDDNDEDDNDDGRENDEDDINNGNTEDLEEDFNVGYCNNDNNNNNSYNYNINNVSEHNGGGNDENNDPNTSKNMGKNESILVDMEYSLNDETGSTLHAEEANVEFEEENETMLRHVRAVQAGLLSNTTEPSDAEIAAAVEAVAVAAAVAQSRNENVK